MRRESRRKACSCNQEIKEKFTMIEIILKCSLVGEVGEILRGLGEVES